MNILSGSLYFAQTAAPAQLAIPQELKDNISYGLLVLIAVAAWRVWRAAGWWTRGLALWPIQLALNLAWSFIFFGAHAPGAALADLVVLWLAIVVTLIIFWRAERLAGLLFVPYLAWVSFAGVLNFWIWQLNR